MAVRIAIVEDEKSAARALEQAIQRYGTENKVSFTIRVWHDPLLFLEEYQAEYDIVYMDIRMPALSGMETARNLRKMDRMVMLIFVTSLAQYALEGYTVGWPLKAAHSGSQGATGATSASPGAPGSAPPDSLHCIPPNSGPSSPDSRCSSWGGAEPAPRR